MRGSRKSPKPFKAMLDSGTTFTFLRADVHDRILNGINWYCQGKKARCAGLRNYDQNSCTDYNPARYPNKQDFYDTFPNIVIMFGKTGKYVWRAKHYLKKVESYGSYEGVKYCNSINKKEGGPNLLGHMFMRGHDFTFERDNYRVSFIESDCEGPKPQNSGRRLVQVEGDLDRHSLATDSQNSILAENTHLMTDLGFVRGQRKGKLLTPK